MFRQTDFTPQTFEAEVLAVVASLGGKLSNAPINGWLNSRGGRKKGSIRDRVILQGLFLYRHFLSAQREGYRGDFIGLALYVSSRALQKGACHDPMAMIEISNLVVLREAAA
jgi:hypothetical protein